MIKRIVLFSLFAMLVLSLFLYLGGVRADTISDYGLNKFLANITKRYNSWSFKIPSIPSIPRLNKPGGSVKELITALIWMVNIFVEIINFLIMLLNFVIMFLNTVIAIIQFILTLVVSVKDWLSLLGVRSNVNLLTAS